MVAQYPTLKMNGAEFVLVPIAEFRRLVKQDQQDARKVASAVKRYRVGKLQTVSHAALKRSLGL